MVNFKHLLYFMHVARSGGVQRASEQLHVTPQTISGQVQLLEQSLGTALFARRGRGLALTEAGHQALGFAEGIFALGAELEQSVRTRPDAGRALLLRAGVADAVPKAIVHRLLAPALDVGQPVRVVARELKLDNLLAELAMFRLDLVISDAPIPSTVSVRAFNHRLGASSVSFFAAPDLAASVGTDFPRCLDGAPLLVPSEDTPAGQRLRAWLQRRGLHPQVLGEFDDGALAREFGRRGAGVFIGPSVLAREIERESGVRMLGTASDCIDEFFVITVQRQITHPCVVAITRSARDRLFATPVRRRRGAAPAG